MRSDDVLVLAAGGCVITALITVLAIGSIETRPLELEVIRLEALVENLERRKQPAPIATDVVLSVPTTDDRIQVSGVGLVYATCLVKANSGEYIPIEEWLADIEAAE